MNLHLHEKDFRNLISLTAQQKNIGESAIERDYYIVLMLQRLAKSEFKGKCVFKGGTSLPKRYPGSIERFSEDIDLTYLGVDESDKVCERALKKIEKLMSETGRTEKIIEERNKRNKSMYVWLGGEESRVKLEIGSTIRPDPYSEKELKTYIQEFLEQGGYVDAIAEYELETIRLNVLNIERTFIDKVMAVKRHAYNGRLNAKVRHIYDVVRLFDLSEIQTFLADKAELKRLISLTKQTDSFYIGRRGVSEEYNPCEAYAFEKWEAKFDGTVRANYESLNETLLFTDEKQDFGKAIATFRQISNIFSEIGE